MCSTQLSQRCIAEKNKLKIINNTNKLEDRNTFIDHDLTINERKMQTQLKTNCKRANRKKYSSCCQQKKLNKRKMVYVERKSTIRQNNFF